MRLVLAIVLVLTAAAPAAGAVRPADGDWRAEGQLGPWSQVLYFTVADHGTRITSTNGLIGNPTSCGWAGAWADPPDIPVSGGAFTAHDTGAADVDPDQLDVTGTFTSRATAELTFTIRCKRSSGPITLTLPFTATTDAPPPPHCATARVGSGGALQLGASGGARAHPKRFRKRAAIKITRSGADCARVEAIMDAVLRERDESMALARAGYVPTRVKRTKLHGRRAYRVIADDLGVGGGGIAYTRYGSIRVDHSIYRAGQQVFLSEEPTKHLLSPCTGAFVVTDPQWGLSGLSAGHCGAPPGANLGLDVERAFGSHGDTRTHLGYVLDSAFEPGVDGVEFSIDGRWGAAQQIERGEKAPLTVLGPVDDLMIGRGTRVCFAGRTSGADTCGRVTGFKKHLRCTSVKARKGDSGGPVYLDPGGELTTRAVGVVSTSGMCFTPLSRLLGRFGAGFPAGPALR